MANNKGRYNYSNSRMVKREKSSFMMKEDIALFRDIPIIFYKKITKVENSLDRKMQVSFVGLHRKEKLSFVVPRQTWSMLYDKEYIEKPIIKGCMKKWPLEDPFEYSYCYIREIVQLVVPQQIGDFTPYWPGIYHAAETAIRMATSDDEIDDLFLSLYNEIIKTDLLTFLSKYRKSSKTSTERILSMSEVPEEVKKFIQRIDLPTIEREVDNDNKNSFDFIRIRLSIPTKDSFPNRKEFIKDNMDYFVTAVLNKLKDAKRYTRYGVPVEYLSLKKATITCTSELEMIFELKDKLRSMILEEKESIK